MKHKNILITLFLFCGTAAANAGSESPDPTELLKMPAALKSQNAQNISIPAKPVTAKLDNTNKTVKPAAANLAAGSGLNYTVSTEPNLPPVGPVAQNNQIARLKRQLWQENISLLPEQDNQPDRDQLEKLLLQLRSAEFHRVNTNEFTGEPVTITVGKSAGTPDPNQAAKNRQSAKAASDANTADAMPALLRQACKNPSAVQDSLELAELLYIKGYLKEAAVFYQETLDRQKPDKQPSPGQKPWILYQLGNCLRQSDPASASKAYKQLITDFPDSQWTASAKVQGKIIDWLQKEKPADILK
jgi:tetratricopeptide (TPR) repeat protein